MAMLAGVGSGIAKVRHRSATHACCAALARCYCQSALAAAAALVHVVASPIACAATDQVGGGAQEGAVGAAHDGRLAAGAGHLRTNQETADV